jgi:hypothetical protein
MDERVEQCILNDGEQSIYFIDVVYRGLFIKNIRNKWIPLLYFP